MHKTTCLIPLQVKSSCGMWRFSNLYPPGMVLFPIAGYSTNTTGNCSVNGRSWFQQRNRQPSVKETRFRLPLLNHLRKSKRPSDLCATSDGLRLRYIVSASALKDPILCRRSPAVCVSFPTSDLAGCSTPALFFLSDGKVCSFLQVFLCESLLTCGSVAS